MAKNDIEKLWSAVCSDDKDYVREYFRAGGEANRRYHRFGHDNSLIMGAYRNGNMEMCRLLISYGEDICQEERNWLYEPDQKRQLIGMLTMP